MDKTGRRLRLSATHDLSKPEGASAIKKQSIKCAALAVAVDWFLWRLPSLNTPMVYRFQAAATNFSGLSTSTTYGSFGQRKYGGMMNSATKYWSLWPARPGRHDEFIQGSGNIHWQRGHCEERRLCLLALATCFPLEANSVWI